MKKFMKKTMSALLSLTAAVSLTASMAVYADIPSNPVISRNCPAFDKDGDSYSAKQGNDEHYFSFWNVSAPNYLAYDLSEVPEDQRRTVMAVWYNTSSYDSIGQYQSRNMEPFSYTIEVNKAPGGEYPAEGWETAVTVDDNSLSSRQHIVDMEGYNWIRMNVKSSDGGTGTNVSINFDIHNVSDGVNDSWLFLGDSITAGGMNNCYGTGFATYVNQLNSRYFPIQENGGIGGIRSIDGRENIDRWLETYPGKYVSIAYGTNDAWGNDGSGAAEYYENTKYMTDAVIAAGKIPVLPKIPYSTNADVNGHLSDFNGMIDRLYEEYGSKLVQGPDFEEFFRENPDYLSSDGVHPSSEGYDAMRRLWAETMYERVYKSGGNSEEDPVSGYLEYEKDPDADEGYIITGCDSAAEGKLVLPASINNIPVTAVNSDAFSGCGKITEIFIPADFSGEFIGTIFNNVPNLEAINVEEENTKYASADGVLFKKGMSMLLRYPENRGINRYNIPDGVKIIECGAFNNADAAEIRLPESVSLIKMNAFVSEKLEKIMILNPECHIVYYHSIENSPDRFDGVILGYEDSTAQEYAKKNGFAFSSIIAKASLYGDANCDGEVKLSDAILVLQSVGNPEKYGIKGTDPTHITEKGIKNADVTGMEDGLTSMDALAIQKFTLYLIDELPVNESV